MRNAHFAFFALGIAFIAIGFSGTHQRAFIYIGLVFLIIALLRWRRTRT
jgi:hypothetical protein